MAGGQGRAGQGRGGQAAYLVDERLISLLQLVVVHAGIVESDADEERELKQHRPGPAPVIPGEGNLLLVSAVLL